MELKGSKTEQNLMTAFAGESQARNKYTYYAGKARKEGYNQIADLFEVTANNEKEHAKLWFKALHGGDLLIRQRIWKMLPTVKTTNGPTCMPLSPKLPKKKASKKSPLNSKWSVKLKNAMKKDIANCCPTLKPVKFSKKAAS